MIRLQPVVMAHPDRRGMVDELVEKLDRPTMVVFDPDPDGEPSCWRTAEAAWRAGLHDCGVSSHVLLLADDVTPCKDLIVGLERALRLRPNRAIAPYANNKRIEEARERGDSWVYVDGGLWGQAQLLPTAWIPAMLTWVSTPDHFSKRYDHDVATMPGTWDDRRVVAFLDAIDEVPLATVPSLVEHRCPSESLVGHANKTRVARWFLGEDRSALEIDWSKGPS